MDIVSVLRKGVAAAAVVVVNAVTDVNITIIETNIIDDFMVMVVVFWELRRLLLLVLADTSVCIFNDIILFLSLS